MGKAARVDRHEAALRDLVEHFVYFGENAGIQTAERFLARAEESFAELARFPEMGRRLRLRSSALAELRRWQVKEFTDFQIFYLTGRGRVAIVRVLRGTRNWIHLLEES